MDFDVPGVIRRILESLGLWAPLATEGNPRLRPCLFPAPRLGAVGSQLD